jgi:hypothetical protein
MRQQFRLAADKKADSEHISPPYQTMIVAKFATISVTRINRNETGITVVLNGLLIGVLTGDVSQRTTFLILVWKSFL